MPEVIKFGVQVKEAFLLCSANVFSIFMEKSTTLVDFTTFELLQD